MWRLRVYRSARSVTAADASPPAPGITREPHAPSAPPGESGQSPGEDPTSVYERFENPAGPHRIRVRMRDTPRESGFDHETSRDVLLAEGQSFVIDFRAELGGSRFL